jgi:hypothetical protein
MNLKSIASSALLTSLMLAAAGSVQATEDVKSFHASGGCKVYGATAWTSLGFGWQGIANTTSSPVQIVCPVVTDAEVNWSDTTATQNAYLHLHARGGAVANTVSCTIFSMYATTVYDTDTVNISVAANDWSNADSPLLNNAGPDGGTLMMCQLGPKTTLSHYTLHEVGATNTP